MPKVYRVMESDGIAPKLGRGARWLGVRVKGDNSDIEEDEQGLVHPGGNGMSVAPSMNHLPSHRIPVRLKHIVSDAAGKSSDFVWAMGRGPFKDGPMCPSLNLHVSSINHGVVCPDRAMELNAYEAALHATQPMWSVDEK